ncbi:FAD-binding oxidoreductase [Marinomonas sp. 5E14-1]|uniref:NAD(P)/FAD-dependent oxidoreductase n=1 Tax=Marinomonas sp. 5E14-1 TaxID=3153922 RepID=UPI003262F7B5
MTQKRISRLPKDPGPSAWNSIIEPETGYDSIVNDIETDWVIVGGGWAGLAAARRLSQLLPKDETITVLEAKRIAEGPAGRNSGFMIDLPHDLNSEAYAGNSDNDLKQIKLNRHAIDFAESAAIEYNMPKAVFSRPGKITAASTAQGVKHIKSYSQHLAEMGESFELKDADSMRGITGSSFYMAGLKTEGGAMVHPAAYIRAFANGLRSRVQIFENSPVLELKTGSSHVLSTPKGKVKARNVILAVNGHIQSFGFFPKRLMHVFTYASMTRKLSSTELQLLGGEPDWSLLPADPMGTTVRKISDYSGSGDRIIVRNLATMNQSLEAPINDMKRAEFMQDRSFKNRFPMLQNVDMEYRWGGRLCLSLNAMPAFGELESRVWSACCQNGLGTVKGTLSGIAAAEQAVLGSSDFLTDFLDHQAPSKLPPEPFLSLGANMMMRWKQWQAGKEL